MKESLSQSKKNDTCIKVIIASHRLPLQIKDGTLIPSDGGLVSAIEGAGLSNESLWVGSLGATASSDQQKAVDEAAAYLPVDLPPHIHNPFYNGYCNQVLWPAFHDRMDLVAFQEESWAAYETANRAFTDAILQQTPANIPVWVHDYHLMLVPQMLKAAQPQRKVGFFLHIPWPKFEVASRVPRLAQLAHSLLSADSTVFHIAKYRSNFLDFARAMEFEIDTVLHSVPVGIAADSYRLPVTSTQRVAKKSQAPFRIIGVDRFDYSKGIDFKLLAYNDFLEMHPEYHGKIILDQLLIPTRENIPAYREYQAEVLSLIEYINRKFGTAQWTPIQFKLGRLKKSDLISFYECGDACFIASVKDGMNLVAMEYLAAQKQSDRPGVLLISDQAGAADFLQAALKFKANSLEEALRCLRLACDMSVAEKEARWRRDMQWILSNSARHWALRNLHILGVDVAGEVATLHDPGKISSDAPAS